MPHDRNGTPLKPGDRVRMEFTVKSLSSGPGAEEACNAGLRAIGPAEQYLPDIACNTGLVERVLDDPSPLYVLSDEQRSDLLKRFIPHSPRGNQAARCGSVRSWASHLAALLTAYCPNSRELSLALTKLDEMVMWANAAIARNEAGGAATPRAGPSNPESVPPAQASAS